MNRLHDFLLNRNVSVVGAFLLGFVERHDGFGITWDDDAGSPRSVAYDRGRYLLGGVA